MNEIWMEAMVKEWPTSTRALLLRSVN